MYVFLGRCRIACQAVLVVKGVPQLDSYVKYTAAHTGKTCFISQSSSALSAYP